MLDLKNCPFCGGKAELSVRGMTAVSRATDLKYYAVVNCPSCEASVCGEATDDEDEAQPLAIAAWNRRALQAVGPEPAVAVKWEQLSEIINAAVKVAIRTGSDFHIDADKLREFACSALVATPPAERVVEALPDDLFTHRDAWRVALVEMRNTSEVSSPDIDDRAYWQHELDVFDRVFAALATKPAVKDDETVVALPPTREYVDRIVRIFRDRPADDTSAVVLQDYARAMLAASPAAPQQGGE